MYNQDTKGDKRTLIAVVLSVIVITAGFMIQGTLFPSAPPPAPAAAAAPAAPSGPVAATGTTVGTPAVAQALVATPPAGTPAGLPAIEAPVAERSYTVETDLLKAVFTNKGGDLVSLKLKQHKDRDGAVDLVLAGKEGPEGFSLAFGGPGAPAVADLMNARMIDERTIEFSRTFLANVPGKTDPVPFTLRKAYNFRNGEYLFGVAVTLENSLNEYLPLNQGGFAYTLRYGPQVGPNYNHLSKNSDYRKIVTLQEGKKKAENPKNTSWNPKSQPTWSAVSGKYFTFIAIPELASYTTTYTPGTSADIGPTTRLEFSRPAIAASRQTDAYYFYFGPKTEAQLAKYEYADKNAFGKSGLGLVNAMDGSGILGWLETALKFAMNLFYKLIPNFGVAIILVTLLVKVILFPLTKKGSISTARMQELQPRMQEIQTKYKANPQKMNQEMAEFYKKEGYNPMSGCLPLLIQFPLFIAMYNLFNTHFDLRGALFIPGWIPDLAAPETIWNFAPFKIPLLGWSDLRLLPIVYLVSQLVYGKFTQQPQTGPAAKQMKFMMYGMPIMFFFILYDVPSGLLVYWIASNLLTIVQQIAINDILKARKAAQAGKDEVTPRLQKGAKPGKGSKR
ncbi:MAG: membrane protein insertase YidC [Spirochaetaceae bacterium]|nr:membrane protein insertase YidC [Spirochaetaceae bacterium]